MRLILIYEGLVQSNMLLTGEEIIVKIWAFHFGDYEEWHLLGCNILWFF
jgi:hypothetical protein